MRDTENRTCKENKTAQEASGWYCDNYCRKIRHVDCEGRSGVVEGAQRRCPYLDEMLY